MTQVLLFCRKIHGETTKNTTTCKHCTEKKPTTEVDLNYHLNTKHTDKIPAEWLHCPNCNWSYSSKESLDIHRSFCKIKIESSEKAFSTEIGFQCQFCPTVFGRTQFNMFYKHAREYHQKQVELDWQKCKICLIPYPTEYSLKRHQR